MARPAGAMTKPPPPRYKIVERDGRLVTIDTWAKKGASDQGPLQRRDIVAAGGGSGESLVAMLIKARDDQGRRLLTTAPVWDRKGPRVIALSARGEARLGMVLLAIAIVMLGVIVAAVVDLSLLMPMTIIAVALLGWVSSRSTSVITRFLDSLGEERPR